MAKKRRLKKRERQLRRKQPPEPPKEAEPVPVETIFPGPCVYSVGHTYPALTGFGVQPTVIVQRVDEKGFPIDENGERRFPDAGQFVREMERAIRKELEPPTAKVYSSRAGIAALCCAILAGSGAYTPAPQQAPASQPQVANVVFYNGVAHEIRNEIRSAPQHTYKPNPILKPVRPRRSPTTLYHIIQEK